MLLGLQCSVQLCPLGFFCVLGEVQHCCVGGRPVVLVCSTNSGFAGWDCCVQGCSGLMSRKRLLQDGPWSCSAPGRRGWTLRVRWQWAAWGGAVTARKRTGCTFLIVSQNWSWAKSAAGAFHRPSPLLQALWFSSKLGAKLLEREMPVLCVCCWI